MVYANGAFVPEGDAKVSVYDRCYLYGDGIFEGVAVWQSAPFRLDAHLDRMFAGLQFLQIGNPLARSEWHGRIAELIRRNEMDDGYLRIQISRGEGMSSIKWEPRLLRKAEPNVFIIPVPGFASYYGALHQRKQEEGYRATMMSRPRIASAAIPSSMKHCNYLNSVIGAMQVTASKCDIGIATDTDGFVTEGIAYNVFIVRNGRVLTPPTTRDILPGITREVIIEIARKAGREVAEADFDAYTLMTADEVFICSTLEIAVPIVEIDGRKIGDGRPGPVTKEISRLLYEEMSREARAYASRRAAE
jgi:branched-chain amino acid aminotransferase